MRASDIDNAAMDQNVLEAIRMDINTAGRIEDKLFGGETNGATMRAVDRSLQRLRKAGKIRYTALKRWAIAVR